MNLPSRTADLYMELKLLDAWKKQFPEQRQDADGVKARLMRRAEIIRDLAREKRREER